MSTKQSSVLGRGLSSLIPNKKDLDAVSPSAPPAPPPFPAPPVPPADIPARSRCFRDEAGGDEPPKNISSDGNLQMVSPELIESNPYQPRSNFDSAAMQELVNSIQKYGMLQPLLVSRKDDGGYQLIIGERRLQAARALNLPEVPVVIKDVHERRKLELALVENIVRENLNPVETALGYKRLVDEFGFTHDYISRQVGRPASRVTNALRLLNLPSEVQEGLREGKITETHGVILAGVPGAEKQLEVYHKVIEKHLSIFQMRREIEKRGGTVKAKVKFYPQDEEMMKKLRDFFGARVDIRRAAYSGKIIINFFSYDELVGIVKKMLKE